MKPEDEASADKANADLRSRDGSEVATAPAIATGIADPAPDLAKTLPGEGIAEKVEALFARCFHGTRLGNDTELWNMVHAFKEDVKKLVA